MRERWRNKELAMEVWSDKVGFAWKVLYSFCLNIRLEKEHPRKSKPRARMTCINILDQSISCIFQPYKLRKHS